MKVEMFNFWYFFWLAICFGVFFLLYFILKRKSEKTIRWVLFGILIFALVLHFLKMLFPPYSTDSARLYRDIWFINICGANIFVFPFIFICKSDKAKDYMFFIGLLSGLISMFYPIEPMVKSNPNGEILDIIRFYIHHMIIWQVPLLMVVLKIHKVNYKSSIFVPIGLLLLMLFIILNQIFQSELGFIDLRGDNLFDIPYKNSSMIWGPDGEISKVIDWACPSFFKTIPVGPHKGETKYWPWFWLIVPCFVILTPLCFGISMIFDHKHFKDDITALVNYFKNRKALKE